MTGPSEAWGREDPAEVMLPGVRIEMSRADGVRVSRWFDLSAPALWGVRVNTAAFVYAHKLARQAFGDDVAGMVFAVQVITSTGALGYTTTVGFPAREPEPPEDDDGPGWPPVLREL